MIHHIMADNDLLLVINCAVCVRERSRQAARVFSLHEGGVGGSVLIAIFLPTLQQRLLDEFQLAVVLRGGRCVL